MRFASKLLGFVAAAVLVAACGGRVVIDSQGLGGGGAGGTTSSSSSATSSSSSSSSSTTSSSSTSSTSSSSSSTTTSSSSTSSTSSSGSGGGLVQLAQLDMPYGVALDADYVYVSEAGANQVVKIPKAGGPPIVVGTTLQPTFMALDADNVYVHSNSFVTALPKAGGPAATFGSTPVDCTALAADAERVYCASYSGSKIIAYDKANGSTTTLSPTGPWPRGLVVDDAFAYWLSDTAGSVGKLPMGGGPASLLDQPPIASGSWNMVGDATRLYWVIGTPMSAEVRSIDKAGGPVTTLATDTDFGIVFVAVDDGHVYWSNNDTQAVRAVPKSGGASTVIASGQGTVQSIAADGSGVYWASYTTGQVMRFTW